MKYLPLNTSHCPFKRSESFPLVPLLSPCQHMMDRWDAVVIPTLLHAAERQRVLSNKVVFRGLVIVLHHEAHQDELRGVDGEAQRVVPHRVEP